MDELIAIKRRWRWKKACQPAHLVIDTFPCEQGSNGSPMPPPCIRLKKNARADCTHHTQCRSRATTLTTKPRASTRDQKSHALLWPPMQARARLRETGAPHGTEASGAGRTHHCAWQQAQQLLAQATALSDAHARVSPRRSTRRCTPCAIRQQSTRLIKGKSSPTVNSSCLRSHHRSHPQRQGNCPAQLWSQPGIVDPATGFLLPAVCPRESE